MSDAVLVEGLRRGDDPGVWREFYSTYGSVIVRYVRKLGLGPSDAEDVLQETMVVLMRKLPAFEYDPAKGKFRNFVLTIVHRKVLSHLRKRTRQAEDGFDDSAVAARDTSAVPGEGAAADELAWRASVAAEALVRLREDPALEPRTLDVFFAYAVERRPVAEVAAQYNIDPNAIYQIKNRLLRRLRARLERFGGVEDVNQA